MIESQWISADQVRPGFVVENPYTPGRLLEVDDVVRFRGLLIFTGWLTDTKAGTERHVDDAKWTPNGTLRLVDDLRDVKAYS